MAVAFFGAVQSVFSLSYQHKAVPDGGYKRWRSWSAAGPVEWSIAVGESSRPC